MAELNRIISSNNFENVIPNDSTDLLQPTKGFLLGSAGAIVIHNYAGVPVTMVGLGTGFIHAISTTRILNTGTVASGIIAFY